MTEHSIDHLFRERPETWGLRGDPYLWEELERAFAGYPLPPTGEMLEAMIRVKIFELTGIDLYDTDRSVKAYESEAAVYIKQFDPGHGMSAGHVNKVWWNEDGIPLLVSRATGHFRR